MELNNPGLLVPSNQINKKYLQRRGLEIAGERTRIWVRCRICQGTWSIKITPDAKVETPRWSMCPKGCNQREFWE